MGTILGIDPGKKGAAVVINERGILQAAGGLEFDKAGMLETNDFALYVHHWSPSIIVIERVRGRGAIPGAAFKGWGATQNFNFGFNYGQIVTMIRMIQPTYNFVLHFVEPRTWQKLAHTGCPKKMAAKDATAWAYSNFYPTKPLFSNRNGKTSDGLIDALFIARWALNR